MVSVIRGLDYGARKVRGVVSVIGGLTMGPGR